MNSKLNPSKLFLLIGVIIYCRGYVPANGTLKFLTFITSELLSTSHDGSTKPNTDKSTEILLAQFKSALKEYQCTQSDQDLWTEFLLIQKRIANLDALFHFMNSLDLLLSPKADVEGSIRIGLIKTSVIGSFVRRSRLDFETLNFQNVISLWQSFRQAKQAVEMAEDYQGTAEQESPGLSDVDAADAVSGGRIAEICRKLEDCNPEQNTPSAEQVFHFQIEQMQSML